MICSLLDNQINNWSIIYVYSNSEDLFVFPPRVRGAADLASVLDDGDDLRILPIVGRGSVQSIADILFLKGVDVGIVRSDTLATAFADRAYAATAMGRATGFSTIGRLISAEATPKITESHHTTS
jgi:hypothetical protein